jgi:hypothetical protein
MSEVIEIGARRNKPPQPETPCDRHVRAVNIGMVVLALAEHKTDDWAGCSFNYPIWEQALALLKYLADMDVETIKGTCEELGIEPYDLPF